MSYGRRTMTYTDLRHDTYSDNGERPVPISIYYPTDEKGESLYEKLYEPEEDMLRKIYSDGKKENAEHLKTIRYPFINNAEPMKVKEKRHLVIISHGLTADRDFFQFLIYKLLDNGFYVITVGHVYDTDMTLIPGTGEVIKMKETLLAESSKEDRRVQVEERGKDVEFILSKLPEINTLDFLDGSIITEDVSLAGHSMGGMTVLQNYGHPSVSAYVLLDASIQFLSEDWVEDIHELYGKDQGKEKSILNFRRGFITYEEKIRYKIDRLKDLESRKFKEYLLKEHEERMTDLENTMLLFDSFKGVREYFIYQDDTHHLSFCDWFILNPEKYDFSTPLHFVHAVMSDVIKDFLLDVSVRKDDSFRRNIQESIYPGIHMQNFEFMEKEKEFFRNE